MSSSSNISEVSIRISVLDNITRENSFWVWNLDEVRVRLQSSCRLVLSSASPLGNPPSGWLPLHNVHRANGNILWWLVSISPHPKSICCPSLPWEAYLYGLHNLDSIALALVWRVRDVAGDWRLGGERGWGIHFLCCLSSPPQFWQGHCSLWLLSGSLLLWLQLLLGPRNPAFSPCFFRSRDGNNFLLLIIPSASLVLVGSLTFPHLCKWLFSLKCLQEIFWGCHNFPPMSLTNALLHLCFSAQIDSIYTLWQIKQMFILPWGGPYC